MRDSSDAKDFIASETGRESLSSRCTVCLRLEENVRAPPTIHRQIVRDYETVSAHRLSDSKKDDDRPDPASIVARGLGRFRAQFGFLWRVEGFDDVGKGVAEVDLCGMRSSKAYDDKQSKRTSFILLATSRNCALK